MGASMIGREACICISIPLCGLAYGLILRSVIIRYNTGLQLLDLYGMATLGLC